MMIHRRSVVILWPPADRHAALDAVRCRPELARGAEEGVAPAAMDACMRTTSKCTLLDQVTMYFNTDEKTRAGAGHVFENGDEAAAQRASMRSTVDASHYTHTCTRLRGQINGTTARRRTVGQVMLQAHSCDLLHALRIQDNLPAASRTAQPALFQQPCCQDTAVSTALFWQSCCSITGMHSMSHGCAHLCTAQKAFARPCMAARTKLVRWQLAE